MPKQLKMRFGKSTALPLIFFAFFVFSLQGGAVVCLSMAGDGTVSENTSFDFLYIDANVGGSSGGHTGIRVDNTVYHFQYLQGGLFRLVRERWPHFRYIYNDLENRSIFVATLRVAPDDLLRIKEHFNRFYLVREAHMNRLSTLKADVKLFEALSRGRCRMALKGAGFFSWRAHADPFGMALRSAVTDQYGPDFLAETLQALNDEFMAISLKVKPCQDFKISSSRYPAAIRSPSRDYAENRLKYAALWVLEKGLPVRRAVLNAMDAFPRSAKPPGLSPKERNTLSSYAKALKEAVVSLAGSTRPDWGYPLLLASARYQAVTRSLKENRLILLDPFPESASPVFSKKAQGNPVVTGALADRAYNRYRRVRKRVFSRKPLDEKTYNRLEESAGRFAELEKGKRTGKPVRVAYGRLVPSRKAQVPLPRKPVFEKGLENSRKRARKRLNEYREKLKKCYPYHLIDNNCATELIRNLNAGFETKAQTVRALGGFIEPNAGFDFVPSYLYGQVKQKMRVTKTRVMPGFRKRRLALMKGKAPDDGLVYLRECNTLTSTVYQGNSQDSAFLLFTDDVIWIRPLYGALNLIYGFLAAGAGVFTAPEDDGKGVSEGLKGALYSLPELLFFNIRKGRFDYVNDEGRGETGQLEKSAPAFDRRVSP